MSRLSKAALAAFVIATLAGSCLHFLYVLLPHPVTALFAPVRESVWEHLKIIFWPYLIASLALMRGKERPGLGVRCLSLLLISALMLLAGWIYNCLMGGESVLFSVCLYVLLMGLGFLLPHRIGRPISGMARDLLALLVIALGVAIILFTFLPPGAILFADLSGAHTWSRLPC